jgi:hypothetical protein
VDASVLSLDAAIGTVDATLVGGFAANAAGFTAVTTAIATEAAATRSTVVNETLQIRSILNTINGSIGSMNANLTNQQTQTRTLIQNQTNALNSSLGTINTSLLTQTITLGNAISNIGGQINRLQSISPRLRSGGTFVITCQRLTSTGTAPDQNNYRGLVTSQGYSAWSVMGGIKFDFTFSFRTPLNQVYTGTFRTAINNLIEPQVFPAYMLWNGQPALLEAAL